MSSADKAAIRALIAATQYAIQRPGGGGQFAFYMIASNLKPPVLEIGVRYVQRYGAALKAA